ncbi:MAG: UDP-glucose/GDP-mannose dehydrogenase family protein [Armatimonadetes bacterium]|nr:UDP-glucose/GDP-mannose dehydrogenase family protein [Armatimonadota bacterium]
MNVTVIGTGYVGLVTACCFAEHGHQVVGVDEQPDKVRRLSSGDPVIYEPGVEKLLEANLRNGRLRFTTDIADGVAASEVLFLCVGTPQGDDGKADLSQIERVTRVIASHLDGYRLLVEKSTVPVKTATWIARTLRLHTRAAGAAFDVASNPEFTREGTAVRDFLEPDRIVIGVDSDRARELLLALYEPFDCPKVVTDVSTAEIIKHASNSFLALKISYINLMAELCEAAGGNVETVAQGMGLDERIGKSFLKAGLGYGGSCFPKDVRAFIRIGQELGVDMSVLQAVDALNGRRIDQIAGKLQRALWVTRDKTVAIWGLAFKPDTDDVRGAPALALAQRLLADGAKLRLYDPKALESAQHLLPAGDRVTYCDSALHAVEGADALAVATDWPEFGQADLADVRRRMTTPVVVDARNMLDPAAVRAAGFEYHSVGRPESDGLA